MKTSKCSPIIIVIAILFLASCSKNDNTLDLQSDDLLQTYELKKTVDGSYYLDYKLSKATSSTILDAKNNVNNIMLYPSKEVKDQNYTEDLGSFNHYDLLKIQFNDTQNDKVTTLIVKDDNIQLNRSESNAFLENYDFKNNGDGTYTLDFVVIPETTVLFEYNEEYESYDIRLSSGGNTNSEITYSRTFTTDENGYLRIAFVAINTSSKFRNLARVEEEEGPRKPVIIVSDPGMKIDGIETDTDIEF